jgi:hypothetical protein
MSIYMLMLLCKYPLGSDCEICSDAGILLTCTSTTNEPTLIQSEKKNNNPNAGLGLHICIDRRL